MSQKKEFPSSGFLDTIPGLSPRATYPPKRHVIPRNYLHLHLPSHSSARCYYCAYPEAFMPAPFPTSRNPPPKKKVHFAELAEVSHFRSSEDTDSSTASFDSTTVNASDSEGEAEPDEKMAKSASKVKARGKDEKQGKTKASATKQESRGKTKGQGKKGSKDKKKPKSKKKVVFYLSESDSEGASSSDEESSSSSEEESSSSSSSGSDEEEDNNNNTQESQDDSSAPLSYEEELAASNHFFYTEVLGKLYPDQAQIEPDDIFSVDDCKILATLEARRRALKWHHLQAEFCTATGRMIPPELIQAKVESAIPPPSSA